MRLRAAVPSLLALSLLTVIPSAHATGCATSTDAAGDIPDKTLDIVSAQVAVVKIPKKPRAMPNVEVTLTVGSTDAKNDPVVDTFGASYYVDFNVKGHPFSFWRHVATANRNPDAFDGTGVSPTVRMTPTTITWVLPLNKVTGLKNAGDACKLRGYVQMANGIVTVDSTA